MKKTFKPEEAGERIVYLETRMRKLENEREGLLRNARISQDSVDNQFEAAQNIACEIEAIRKYRDLLAGEVDVVVLKSKG